MSTLNTMRAMLVGGAVFAAVVAMVFGQWSVVGILGLGIAAHAALWVHLRRSGQPTPAPRQGEPPAAGTPY